MTGRRILFCSVSYRPEHAGIGPYAAATAERLAAEGAEVDVVAGMPHYPSWRVARSDRWRLRRREILGGLRVTRLRQLVPRRQSAFTRGLYDLSFLLNGIAMRRVSTHLDLVVAVVPSLAGGLLAGIVASRRRVPLVLIVQDLSTAGARQSGILGGRLVAYLVGGVESRLFRRAAAVGVVHDSLVASCLEMGVRADRIRTVPNWSIYSPPQNGDRHRHGGEAGTFTVLHAGNMGLKQGLEVVVDTARLAQERGQTDLRFTLMGDGSQRGRLERLAHDLPAVRLVPPVPDEDFLAALGQADLALVTQRAQVHDMSVPSKLTAYWNAGRAVVASVAAESGTAREVRRSGGGVVVEAENPHALLAAIEDLRDAPERIADLEETGHRYAVEHLSARSGLDRVVALVEFGLGAQSEAV